MTPDEVAENIFDIVGQFNAGVSLISDPNERERVAELNRDSGQKAKASAAYASACIYFSHGQALLGDDGRERLYKLAIELWLARAGCSIFWAKFDGAQRLVWPPLRRSTSR